MGWSKPAAWLHHYFRMFAKTSSPVQPDECRIADPEMLFVNDNSLLKYCLTEALHTADDVPDMHVTCGLHMNRMSLICWSSIRA